MLRQLACSDCYILGFICTKKRIFTYTLKKHIHKINKNYTHYGRVQIFNLRKMVIWL